MRRLLYAAYFFEVGLLLAVVPWSSFWDHNVILEAVSWVHALSRNPYIKGAVTGLGLVNLGLCLSELHAAWRGRHVGPGLRTAGPADV